MRHLSFSSENFSGAHNEFLRAINEASTGQVQSYGDDDWTKAAIASIKRELGKQAEVYFTFNGTGANLFGLSAVTQKYQAIYCSDVAHIYAAESTGAEALTGCRLYPVKSDCGKIEPHDLEKKLCRVPDFHHPYPGVVSVSQPTEYGTVYTIEELQALKVLCIAHNMLLHVDGARFFNAAANLKVSLKEQIDKAGIDLLTLGGTKIGMLFGEAVVFFGVHATSTLRHLHKRSTQLASKNRFIAVQFQRLFENDFWHDLASHTNNLAKYFEQQLKKVPGISIVYPVETNMVFLKIPLQLYLQIQVYADFKYWNVQREEARLVFSFDNTFEEVDDLLKMLERLPGKKSDKN